MGNFRLLSEHRLARAAIETIGLLLVVAWLIWWGANLQQNRMIGADATWVNALPFLSGDFLVSIDHVARIRAMGFDAYSADWVCSRMPYPPAVEAFFAWTVLFTPKEAAEIWTLALAAIATLAGVGCWSTRRRLGLENIPAGWCVALVLFSTPVLCAVERCNCDLLIVPLVLAAAHLLREPNHRAQLLAGVALGMAAWVKYYPGLALIGLLVMRRWSALLGFCSAGILIALADVHGAISALENTPLLVPMYQPTKPEWIAATAHSLSGHWLALWADLPLAAIGYIDGVIAAAMLLLPLAIWVSRKVAAGPRGSLVFEAYLLWLIALATFLPKSACDYNLIFLPMAMICVWTRRDSWLVHGPMLLAVAALQPVAFHIAGRPLLLFKLCGLVATGLCLARRATEPASDLSRAG
jgi:hypothetical protein